MGRHNDLRDWRMNWLFHNYLGNGRAMIYNLSCMSGKLALRWESSCARRYHPRLKEGVRLIIVLSIIRT